ncbi:hypothetical protein BH11MYX2_BH11MYX2_10190 [soil metagenome]
MKPHLRVAFVVVAACSSPPSSRPELGSVPAQHTEQALATTPPPTPSAKPRTDISSDEQGWRVGEPRWRALDTVAARMLVRGDLVFAVQGSHVSAWDLQTGAKVRDVDVGGHIDAMAVSYDGHDIAADSGVSLHILGANNRQLLCGLAFAFSHNGKLLACSAGRIAVLDLATNKEPWPSPISKQTITVGAAFSSDDKAVFFATEHEVARWDLGDGTAPAVIYKTQETISRVAFSESGVAMVMQGKLYATNEDVVVIDLAKGTTTALGKAYSATLSPSGTLAAIFLTRVMTVFDVATQKPRWSRRIEYPVQRLAFSADAQQLIYIESGQLRVVDLATDTVRTGPPSSRFVGWLDASHIAVDLAGTTSSLSLADGATTVADRTKLLPLRTPDVPAWAEQIIVAPSGTITAAEGDPRHDISPYTRQDAKCKPSLRVWTASGGIKTLKMVCSEDLPLEPGWTVGGDTAIALTGSGATVYRASTGSVLVKIPVEPPTSKKNPNEPWAAAASDDGTSIAVLWRAPAFGETEDPDEERTCMEWECGWSYTVDEWTLQPKPRRTSRHVLTGPASDAITFDHAGKRLLVGFQDGTIHALEGDKDVTIRKHVFEVLRISVGPGDQWVFSEDLTGEQRVWRAQ